MMKYQNSLIQIWASINIRWSNSEFVILFEKSTLCCSVRQSLGIAWLGYRPATEFSLELWLFEDISMFHLLNASLLIVVIWSLIVNISRCNFSDCFRSWRTGVTSLVMVLLPFLMYLSGLFWSRTSISAYEPKKIDRLPRTPLKIVPISRNKLIFPIESVVNNY